MIKVKVCGITNLDDAFAAVDYGADALGYIFARSPRQVTPELVKGIIAKLPPFVCNVGVFVNNDIAEVRETISFCGLDMVQLHGDEDPDYCAALFPKSIKVFTSTNLPAQGDLKRYQVAAFMLDIEKGATIKDTEQRKLWYLARDIAGLYPIVLAGGLTPENVGRAIETARPYAVDVSSGVESAPGKKDHEKLGIFIQVAKQTQSGGKVEVTR
ncbi:MAG: phosphoribosylanthranilate isomerase [Dehalococcoidia bacterium]|nr:MAG: phosphoribosylanthranilate isomerase [Dehalococcoidia bacterium]UCG83624.1 MAG: phosphoribosylanthranilate isomerase [Dehalococcoidia bacterium]